MFLIPYRDENPSRTFPFLTLILIGVNAALFFWSYKPDLFPTVALRYGFSPQVVLQRPQVMVTSLFLHGNLLHLISNMWFLWLFGDNVEDKFGRASFLLLYLISGVAGNLMHMLFTFLQSPAPVIGASGAVAGVMGSYLVRFPSARIRCVFFIIFYPVFFRLYAIWFIGFWMLMEFLAAYLAPLDYVAHWAHVGGFAFGFIWAYGRRDRFRRYRAV